MLGLQPASRIHQHQLSALGLGSTDGVVDDGGRIGIGAGIGDHRHLAALTPHLHLLHRRGPEGVSSSDQAAVAAAHRQVGQLAERGRLTNAVYPHQQPHVELLAAGG